MWITTISTACLFANCKTGAYQSTQRRLGTEHPTTNLLKWAIQAGRAAKAPRELLRLQNSKSSTETHFPISPKTGRGRGGLCFITIGQITADPLVYVFLTSLIAAKEKKNPCKAAGSWDRIMKRSMFRGSCCLDRKKSSRCDMYFYFFFSSLYVVLEL